MTRGFDGTVHVLLPGLSRTPVGGYRVAYEYANELSRRDVVVHLWHSSCFYGEMADDNRLLRPLKAFAHRVRAQRSHDRPAWFELAPGVISHVTARLPRPAVAPGDIVLSTAVLTARTSSDLASAGGASSVGLIQHYETWGVDATYVKNGWAVLDERVVIAPWLGRLVRDAGLTFTLIPNAVDPREFPAGPALESRPQQVLSLISDLPFKRADVVSQAFDEIHRLSPHVTCIAFGQAERPPILPPHVTYIHDPTPAELRALYQSSQVYFCGSDAEGWHLPPAEATLSGAAVVSTDIDGVRVSMESDARYSEPGDGVALGRQVLEVLSDLTDAQRRVTNARSRLLERTIASNTDELVEVFTRLRRR